MDELIFVHFSRQISWGDGKYAHGCRALWWLPVTRGLTELACMLNVVNGMALNELKCYCMLQASVEHEHVDLEMVFAFGYFLGIWRTMGYSDVILAIQLHSYSHLKIL